MEESMKVNSRSRRKDRPPTPCIVQLSAVGQQHFETRPLCFCLSKAHVIVACLCHFWNDNSGSLGYFPLEFLDAHLLIEK